MVAEKNCRCGHPRRSHRNDRGQDGRNLCRGEVRQFIYQIPDQMLCHKRDSDIQLTLKQAEHLVAELGKKVEKAPSYEGKLKKLLRCGYRILTCECPTYHTVDIGGVNIIKPQGAKKRERDTKIIIAQ